MRIVFISFGEEIIAVTKCDSPDRIGFGKLHENGKVRSRGDGIRLVQGYEPFILMRRCLVGVALRLRKANRNEQEQNNEWSDFLHCKTSSL